MIKMIKRKSDYRFGKILPCIVCAYEANKNAKKKIISLILKKDILNCTYMFFPVVHV